MSLYVDLTEQPQKSKFNIVLGGIFLIFSITTIMIKLRNNDIYVIDWIVNGTYILCSSLFLMKGCGFSIENFLGKAYISIDDEKLAIKTNAFKKEQSIRWENVKSITYKLNKYEVLSKTNEKELFNLSDLPFQIKQQMKEAIGNIAKEKNIEINSI